MKVIKNTVEGSRKRNKKGVDSMTTQEKIQKHVQEKCRYCLKKECDGIHITVDGKTKCDADER